jgi:hypothetical protein
MIAAPLIPARLFLWGNKKGKKERERAKTVISHITVEALVPESMEHG